MQGMSHLQVGASAMPTPSAHLLGLFEVDSTIKLCHAGNPYALASGGETAHGATFRHMLDPTPASSHRCESVNK